MLSPAATFDPTNPIFLGYASATQDTQANQPQPDQQTQQQPLSPSSDYSSFGNPQDPNFYSQNMTTVTSPSGVKFAVNKNAARAFTGFLGDLEAGGYKVNQSQSGGYNLRDIAGTHTLSPHAYGLAIDVNWNQNPRLAEGQYQSDMPGNVSQLATKWGLSWGGDWSGSKDPMHFEYTGKGPFQVASASTDQRDFVNTYMPYAERVGKELGVNPNIIAAQWANESGWGKHGDAAAIGNMAGLKDNKGNYIKFNTPQDFANAYIDRLRQDQYGGALNAGSNSGQFVGGLKRGGYFTGDQDVYQGNVDKIASTIASISGNPLTGRPAIQPPINLAATTAPASSVAQNPLALQPAPAPIDPRQHMVNAAMQSLLPVGFTYQPINYNPFAGAFERGKIQQRLPEISGLPGMFRPQRVEIAPGRAAYSPASFPGVGEGYRRPRGGE